jgi:hypothetical protein
VVEEVKKIEVGEVKMRCGRMMEEGWVFEEIVHRSGRLRHAVEIGVGHCLAES